MSSTKIATNNTNTSTKTFRCPVDHCGQQIHENPRQIADHIKKGHPTISKRMYLASKPTPIAFICKPCESYTSFVHHHCFECEHPENGGESRFFKTVQERDSHLKKDHAKWWFEYECKYGISCRGKKGGCGFNHNHFENTFITDTEEIPSVICRYDRPWDNLRCTRDKCSFSHFWGRVRYLIKSRAENERLTSASASTCNGCDTCPSSTVKPVLDVAVLDEVQEEIELDDDDYDDYYDGTYDEPAPRGNAKSAGGGRVYSSKHVRITQANKANGVSHAKGAKRK